MASDLLDELRDSISAARYSSSSVLASLAVTLGLSALLFLVFLLLRPRIKTLYASKPHGTVQSWEYPGDGVFAWVRPLYRSGLRTDLQHRLGLDAVVFLRIQKSLRNMFVCLAIVGCGVAIPVNVYFNWKSPYLADNLSRKDAFVLMTPTLVQGMPMLAHVIVGWIVDIIVMAHMWFTFRWILNLRRDYFNNYQHRRETRNRTLMAVDIDKQLRSENGLLKIAFKCDNELRPANVSVGRDVKHLEELISEHTATVLALENQLLKNSSNGYVSTPGGMNDKVARLTNRKEDLEQQIAQERFICRKENRPQSYGFISYPTQNEAHRIAKDARNKSPEGSEVRLAPHPTDIIWSNASLNIHQRRSMNLTINLLYAGLLLLWIVPAAILGCFVTNMKRIGTLWPAFARSMEAHPVGFAILQGVVGPFIMMMVFMMLPVLMRRLVKWQGSLTRTDREKEVTRKLFVLFFLINFIVFTCMGVIWDVIVHAISLVRSGKGPSFNAVWDDLRISQRLATAVIDISSFWVMYLLRAITELFTSIAQVLSLLIRIFQRACNTVTPRTKASWEQPEPFPYAASYTWPAFYTAIALGITTIQPLVLAINAIYFTVALPFKKYELMYMYYTKYESNGLFWPVVHNIVIVSALFGNLVLLCVVWVQGNWKIAMGVVPLPFIMIIYKVVTYYQFDRHYWYFVDASDDEKGMINAEGAGSEDLDELYENPVLSMPLEAVILSSGGQKQPSLDEGDKTPITKESIPDDATLWPPEPFEGGLESKPYISPYHEPMHETVPSIHADHHTIHSPASSCPYPEQAMFSNSAISLVNDNVYSDERNLLASEDNDHLHEEHPHAYPGYHPYHGSSGRSAPRYYGEFE